MTNQGPPIPVATLAYQPPLTIQRPGILTAVAVISIVFASLSALASVGGAFSSAAFLMMSKISPSTFTPPTVQATAVRNVTEDGVAVDPAGSEEGMDSQKRQVVVIGLMQAWTPTVKQRGNLDLLLENSGETIFPGTTDSTTSDEIAKRLIARHAIPSDGSEFVLDTGTIRLTDLGATFRPAGKGAVVRASVSAPATAPVVPPVAFPFKVNPTVAITSIIENIVSLLVAIMLLVAGILLTRNSPKFYKPHWWFVWLKIPLVLIASATYYLNYSTMMSGIATMPGGAAASSTAGAVMIVPTMMWAVVGLAYPVALIFVLSSRTVRLYYNAVRGIEA